MFSIVLMVCVLAADEVAVVDTRMKADDLCGVLCAYGVLQTFPNEPSLDEVKSAFDGLARTRQHRGYSMTEVEEVLSKFGVKADGIVCHGPRFSGVTTPAILYIRPARVGSKHLGHFIILSALDEKQATLIDFERPEPIFTVDTTTLAGFWDGEALVMSEQSNLAAILRGTGIAIMVATAVIALYVKVLLKRSSSTQA
jgi:ABC-type bacteriocin/lantibiotic exporter with double-glycine peptidase domain